MIDLQDNRKIQGECRAAFRRALKLDFSAEQMGKLPGNRKPETGSAVFPRGPAVRLVDRAAVECMGRDDIGTGLQMVPLNAGDEIGIRSRGSPRPAQNEDPLAECPREILTAESLHRSSPVHDSPRRAGSTGALRSNRWPVA